MKGISEISFSMDFINSIESKKMKYEPLDNINEIRILKDKFVKAEALLKWFKKRRVETIFMHELNMLQSLYEDEYVIDRFGGEQSDRYQAFRKECIDIILDCLQNSEHCRRVNNE